MKLKNSLVISATLLLAGAMTFIAAKAEETPANRAGHVDGKGKGHGAGKSDKMPGFEPLPVTEEQANEPVVDDRIHVPMPAEQKAILRQQMKQFLASLMQIQGLMADNDLAGAAEIAETSMGRSERGQHRGKGPGLYMPVPMRSIAWTMHEKASVFAETARKGDVKESYKALQSLQGSCVSCHFSYSTR